MSRARDLADGTFSGAFSADSPTFVVDDANNRVGVGTVSPSSLLDVDKSQNAETNIELTNTNTGSAAQVRTKYTTDGGLFTVGKTSNAHAYGGDAYIHNVDNTNIRFATNDTERLRILSSGGITFNGDTAAANALDDYEEGDYDVTVTPETSGSVSLYNTSNRFSYTKIGRVVHVNGWVQVYSVSSPVGDYIDINLPFIIADLTDVSGRVGAGVVITDASTPDTVNVYGSYGIEGYATLSIFVDASTLANGDDIIIDLNYNAS